MTKFEEEFQLDLEELIDGVLDDDISDSTFDGKKTKFIEKYAPQALPVVPECVDYEIKYRRNNSYSGIEPSDGLLLMQVFQDLNCNGRMDRSGEEGYWQDGEFYKWMQSSQNFPVFFKAVTEGYTVEKPQLFYLKNKLTTSYLALDTNTGYYEHWGEEIIPKSPIKQGYKIAFTQQEIDKMQTGSYELVPVEE